MLGASENPADIAGLYNSAGIGKDAGGSVYAFADKFLTGDELNNVKEVLSNERSLGR